MLSGIVHGYHDIWGGWHEPSAHTLGALLGDPGFDRIAELGGSRRQQADRPLTGRGRLDERQREQSEDRHPCHAGRNRPVSEHVANVSEDAVLLTAEGLTGGLHDGLCRVRLTADLLARRADKIDRTEITLRPVLLVLVAFAALMSLVPALQWTTIWILALG